MTNQDEEERKRRDAIEARAYEIYQGRGSADGMDEDDWQQAEREVDGIPNPGDLMLPDSDEVEEDKGAAA